MLDDIAGSSGRRSSDVGFKSRATALVASALAASVILAVAAPQSTGAQKQSGKRNLFAAAYLDHRPGGLSGGQFQAEGLFQASQTGPASRKGTRPMGIIAILIGLKAGQNYALTFSTKRCGQGGGGLIGSAARFTASPAGEAVVKRRYRLKPKVLRRSNSVVLLSRATGKRFQACGRLIAGDYNQDGSVDASD